MTLPSPHMPERIETARLVLRLPARGDVEPMAAWGQSPRRHYIGTPMSREEAVTRLYHIAGHWLIHGFGYYAVEETATGAVVGHVGVRHYIEAFDEPELGWQLFDGAEGRGLAQEAAEAVRQGWHRAFGAVALVSLIHPENERSRALARRLGCTHEAMRSGEGWTAEVWRHPVAEAA